MIENREQIDRAYRLTRYAKKHRLSIGVLLTTFGFAYQVLGVWPGWNAAYYWGWQEEIARHWGFLVLPLFVLSLLSLVIGIVLLYVDSIQYRKKHPELYENEI